MSKCSACGFEIQKNADFCANCGNKIKKRKGKKAIIIISSCLLAVVAVVVAAVIIINSCVFIKPQESTNNSFALYAKNGKLFVSTFNEEPIAITSHRDAYTEYMEAYNVQEWGLYDRKYIEYSKESNRLFFADIKGDFDESLFYNLCYIDLNNPQNEPIEIDTSVFCFDVVDGGNSVIYQRSNDCLYKSNLKSTEKIVQNIESYTVSTDGNTVFYTEETKSTDTDGNEYNNLSYYLITQNQKPIILEGENDIQFTQDKSIVFYIKDSTLFKISNGKAAEKISGDVIKLVKTYNTGEAYYLKKSEKVLWDFVIDDLSADDANRVTLYNELNAPNKTSAIKGLYYNDGKNEHLVTNEYFNYAGYNKNTAESCTIAKENPAMLFYSIQNATPIVSLSNIIETATEENISYFEAAEKQIMYSGYNEKITLSAKSATTNLNINLSNISIFFKGNTVYLKNSDNILYSIELSGNTLGTLENYAEFIDNVDATENIMFCGDEPIYCDGLDLYIGQKRIDSTARLTENAVSDKKIIYFTDWDATIDTKHVGGTLMIYENGKSKKIDDDVYDFYVTANDDIVYLHKYDLWGEKQKGYISVYKNGKCTNIDKNITMLMPY